MLFDLRKRVISKVLAALGVLLLVATLVIVGIGSEVHRTRLHAAEEH